MHILYLQQLLVLPGSPGNDRCFDFAKRYVAAGHQVTFISSEAAFPPESPYKGKKHFELEGISVHVLPVAYSHMMSFRRRAQSFISFYRKALRIGKSLKGIDLVLAYSAPLSVGQLGAKLAHHHQCPFVFEVADVWPDVPIGMGIISQNWLGNFLLRRADKIYAAADTICCFSEGMKDQICAHQIPQNKVHVVHNGAATDQINFVKRNPDPNKVEVIYAGTTGVANDLSQLIQAAKILEDQGHTQLHFTLLGKGNDYPNVKATADQLKVKNLTFLDTLPRDQVAGFLAKADIGIVSFAPHPVLEANSATKFYDYLASGLPIVLNYEGWQADYLYQHQCGLFSPQGNILAFAQNILKLAQEPELRQQFAQRGRQLAEQKFDRALLAQKMLDLMTKLA